MNINQISLESVVSQVDGQIVSDMGGEKVMLSIYNGKYYNLGVLGGRIWEEIITPTSIEKVVINLLSDYDVHPKECQEQVISFLISLHDENLIKVEEM